MQREKLHVKRNNCNWFAGAELLLITKFIISGTSYVADMRAVMFHVLFHAFLIAILLCDI